MLNYIFPKVNELSIFVITVSLYSMAFYVPEVERSFLNIAEFTVSSMRDSWVIVELTDVFGAIVFSLIIISCVVAFFVGPLIMPFTQCDLRHCGFVVLMVDAALSIHFNLLNINQNSTLRTIFIIYSFAWLGYLLLNFKREKDTANVICDEKSDPKTAIAVSISAILIILFLYFVLEWLWLDSYFSAIAFSFLGLRFSKMIQSYFFCQSPLLR